MAELGKSSKVAVSNLGKWKTTAQMAAIGCLLYRDDLFGLPVRTIGYVALYIAAILTFWSMYQYLKVALQTLAAK
jgi:phosphatidylglycerophosphate synthase